MSLLAIDVGAGTQDILLYDEAVPLEGSTKMVLPSQTVIVGRRIEYATAMGQDIFLRGPTMGGGACVDAIRSHLLAGRAVYATPTAAATINDNLKRVASYGVRIVDEAPARAQVIETGDLDLSGLCRAFGIFNIKLPEDIAVAVQDHGFSPERSNRAVRFEHLREALRQGGQIEAFAYREPPEEMTRMRAASETLALAGYRPLLMDTGAAAIFGAASGMVDGDLVVDWDEVGVKGKGKGMDKDEDCERDDHDGPVMIINFGNGHTVAAVLDDGRITGIFEHHTDGLSNERLWYFVNGLADGSIKNSEVFEDGGHGAHIESVPGRIERILVTGPRRQQFLACGAIRGAIPASPGGDMMMTGPIGLVCAWRKRERLWR